MRKTLLSVLSFFISLHLFAQEKATIAVVEFFTPTAKEVYQANRPKPTIPGLGGNNHSRISSNMRKLEGFVVEALVADQRFTVVERRQIDLLENETELQKSEEFIDGYVVGQSRRIGAEYLMFGDIGAKGSLLTLSLFDVKKQETSEKKTIDLTDIKTQESRVRRRVMTATQQILFEVAPPKILVVKELSGNNRKTISVLVSGGTKYGMRKGQVLQAKQKQMETIDGEQFERMVTVARLLIREVENEHFSRCMVQEGEKELKRLIGSGSKLYCFPTL